MTAASKTRWNPTRNDVQPNRQRPSGQRKRESISSNERCRKKGKGREERPNLRGEGRVIADMKQLIRITMVCCRGQKSSGERILGGNPRVLLTKTNIGFPLTLTKRDEGALHPGGGCKGLGLGWLPKSDRKRNWCTF